MEDCRTAIQIAEWNSDGKRRRGKLVNACKNGFRDRMQRRNLNDKERFVRGLWREKKGANEAR
jgi:hypothetical protein